MSVKDKLTLLTNHLVSAYDAVRTKGGTVPSTKNYNNLSGAIDTVPGGNGGGGSNGGDLYLHLIFFGASSSFMSACCKIYSNSPTPYTLEAFNSFLYENGFDSQDNCYPAQGTCNFLSFYWRKTNTGSKTQWYYGKPVNGVYRTKGTAGTVKLVTENVTDVSIGTSNFSSKVIKVASAGDKLYMHNLNVVNGSYAMLNGQIITNSSTPFTYATFNTFLRDNSFTSNKNWFPMSGMRTQTTLYYYSSSSATTLLQMAQCDTSFGVYSYSTSYVYEVYQTTSTTSPTGKSITSSNFKDTVVEVA